MGKFRLIDEKLKNFAEILNAKLATDGSGFSVNGVAVPKELIEERRVIWVDGQIGKAVIIHPIFLTLQILVYRPGIFSM